MRGLLVDSNIILDVFLNDPIWADWSVSQLTDLGDAKTLYINTIIYSEVSVGFDTIEALDSSLQEGEFQILDIPKEALFLAGKAFLTYRKRKGVKRSPLPDFYIGAQAAVLQMDLMTRDPNRYRTYFPTVKLICPK
jgi:hypothetical protein